MTDEENITNWHRLTIVIVCMQACLLFGNGRCISQWYVLYIYRKFGASVAESAGFCFSVWVAMFAKSQLGFFFLFFFFFCYFTFPHINTRNFKNQNKKTKNKI